MDANLTERYRAALYSEREDLRRHLEELGANPDEGTVEGLEFDEGFADSAQATAERAKVLAMIENLRERLAEVHAGLERIDRGTYGVCQSCGQPIAPERLEALPTANLCVPCKQKQGA